MEGKTIDDAALKAMIAQINVYCEEKGYALVLSVGDEDKNINAYAGYSHELIRQFLNFVKEYEDETGKLFARNLSGVLSKYHEVRQRYLEEMAEKTGLAEYIRAREGKK